MSHRHVGSCRQRGICALQHDKRQFSLDQAAALRSNLLHRVKFRIFSFPIPSMTEELEEFLKQLFSLPPWDRCCAGGMVWKCLYSARLIEDLRFPVDREVLEDEIFNTQAAARMTKAAYFPDALYGYRIRAASLVVNGRFAERVIRCRKLCAQTARTISEEAYRITCAAYTASVLSYYKNTPHDARQATFLVELPMADVKASLKAGFLSQKHWLSYRLMRCPSAFRLFLGARQLAHNFKERLRRLRGR